MAKYIIEGSDPKKAVQDAITLALNELDRAMKIGSKHFKDGGRFKKDIIEPYTELEEMIMYVHHGEYE